MTLANLNPLWWSIIKHPGVTVGRVDDAKPRSLAGTPPPGVHPCYPAGTLRSSWQLWSQGTKLFVVKFLRCLVQGNWMTRQLGLETLSLKVGVTSHELWVQTLDPIPSKFWLFIKLHISWSFIYCSFRTYIHQLTCGIFVRWLEILRVPQVVPLLRSTRR